MVTGIYTAISTQFFGNLMIFTFANSLSDISTTTTVYFNEVVFPSVLGLTSPMAFPQHSPPP